MTISRVAHMINILRLVPVQYGRTVCVLLTRRVCFVYTVSMPVGRPGAVPPPPGDLTISLEAAVAPDTLPSLTKVGKNVCSAGSHTAA